MGINRCGLCARGRAHACHLFFVDFDVAVKDAGVLHPEATN